MSPDYQNRSVPILRYASGTGGRASCIMSTTFHSRPFGRLRLKMGVGVLLVIFALLQTIKVNRWSESIFPYLSEINWASPKTIIRERELVGDLMVDAYQGTLAPIGQPVAPTPSIQIQPSILPIISSAPSTTYSPTLKPSQGPSPGPTLSYLPSLPPSSSPWPSTSPSILPSNSPSASVAPSVAPSTSFQPTATAWPSATPTSVQSENPSPYPSSLPSEPPSSMPSLQSDLYAEHLLTIVLDGVQNDFRPARWQVETSNFIKSFWDDQDTNIHSPVFVGRVETRYIKQSRIGDLARGADNTSLPLAIEYQQLINYTMVADDYNKKLWGDLKDTLFTYPYELNTIGYMALMVAITDNPSAIFLSSYKITTPKVEEIGSSGTDAAIIAILVIVVALVLLGAALYVMHLLRKDRDAHEELLKVDQGDLDEMEDGEDRPAFQEVIESPAVTRFQGSATPMPLAQPGHKRVHSSDAGSDRDDNANNPHRRRRSNSNVDDMSDLEGMVIDSQSAGDGDEEDTARPMLAQAVDGGYVVHQYGSRDEDDESDDDYEDNFHPRQTGFIMKVEDIDD